MAGFYSIRQKFALVYFGILLLGLLALLLNYYGRIHPLLEKTETRFAEEKQHRVSLVLQRELLGLHRVAHDWGNWSAMANFVQKPTPQFIADNFTPATLQGLDLALLAVFDRQAKLRYFSAALAQEPVAYWQSFLTSLQARLPIVASMLASQTVPPSLSGFLYTEQGVVLLTLQPVTHTDERDSWFGFVLMAKRLDPDYLLQVAGLNNAHFTMRPMPVAASLTGVEQIEVQRYRAGQYQIKNGDTQTELQFRLLDINQQNNLLATLTFPRELDEFNGRSLETAAWFIFCALVGVFLLLGWWINKSVLHPLLMLQRYVLAVRQSNDFVEEPLLPQDEIGALGRSFTGLLDELMLKQRTLTELSYRDPLTGVANRRHFDEAWRQRFVRAQQLGHPIALLMIDIDYFKQYNDYYGHPQGDVALQRVAACFVDLVVEPLDLVARYGGEEFAVILADCDETRALFLAESMRAALARQALPHQRSRCAQVMTISCGVMVGVPDAQVDAKRWLLQADEALYQAKTLGRNRVAMFLHDQKAQLGD